MDFLDGVTRRLSSFIRQPPPTGPRLQILSDIHLEVGLQYKTFTFPATAPFLLLAGDTGYISQYDGYLAFLEAQVSRFERVFVVLGNHEFYKGSYEATIEAAQRLEKEPSLEGKMVLLHRRRWDYNGDDESLAGFTILGCTLWSTLPNDESRELIQLAVSDYKHIENWNSQRHHDTHLEEVAWLREQVAQIATEDSSSSNTTKRQILIVSHHAPSRKDVANPHKTASPWFNAYSTELVEGSRWPGVKAWVFGHTHYSVDFVRRGIRVYANQRGYVLPNSTDDKREREQLEGKVERKPHGFDASASVQLW